MFTYEVYTALERYHRIMLNKLIKYVYSNQAKWESKLSAREKLEELTKIKTFLDNSHLFSRPEEQKVHISAYTTYKRIYQDIFESEYIHALKSNNEKNIKKVEEEIKKKFESDIRRIKSKIGLEDHKLKQIEKVESRRLHPPKSILVAASLTLLFLISNTILATNSEKIKHLPFQTEKHMMAEIQPEVNKLLRILPKSLTNEETGIYHWAEEIEYNTAKMDSIQEIKKRITTFLEEKGVINSEKWSEILGLGYDNAGNEMKIFLQNKFGSKYKISKKEKVEHNYKIIKGVNTKLDSATISGFTALVQSKTTSRLQSRIKTTKKQRKLAKLFGIKKYKVRSEEIVTEEFKENLQVIDTELTREGNLLFSIIFNEAQSSEINGKEHFEEKTYIIQLEVSPR